VKGVTPWANLAFEQNKIKTTKKGEVDDQLKIEYMLRYSFKQFLQTIYPYVPMDSLKELMDRLAPNGFKASSSISKLYKHLKQCSTTAMNQPSFESSWSGDKYFPTRKKFFLSINPNGEFVNLKELRDQIMQKRCSNE